MALSANTLEHYQHMALQSNWCNLRWSGNLSNKLTQNVICFKLVIGNRGKIYEKTNTKVYPSCIKQEGKLKAIPN